MNRSAIPIVREECHFHSQIHMLYNLVLHALLLFPLLVIALYGNQNSNILGQFNYASYIYLLAPISLGIVNPIGFFMMEYQKQRELENTRRGSVLKQIFILLGRTLRYVL